MKYFARLFYHPGLIASGYYHVALDAIPEKWEVSHFDFVIPANVCQICFLEKEGEAEKLVSPIIHIRPAGGRVVTADQALEMLGVRRMSKDEAIGRGRALNPVAWDIIVNERMNLVYFNNEYLIFNKGDILVIR